MTMQVPLISKTPMSDDFVSRRVIPTSRRSAPHSGHVKVVSPRAG